VRAVKPLVLAIIAAMSTYAFAAENIAIGPASATELEAQQTLTEATRLPPKE
jgi:hypothetical protein